MERLTTYIRVYRTARGGFAVRGTHAKRGVAAGIMVGSRVELDIVYS